MSCVHTSIHHWTALDPFILDLLTPPQIRSAIITLQRNALRFLAVKLRRKMELEQLFKNQKCLQILLAPKGTLVYHPIHGSNVIKPGDHLVVLLYGISYHHAIFMGLNEKGIPEVADFSSPSGRFDMKDSEIRIYGLVDFMEQRKWIGVVPYDQDSHEIRERTVAIARAFASSDISLPDYNIATWNCETFVLVCKTANVSAISEQVAKLRKAMEQYLPTAIALGLSISRVSFRSSCQIM